MDKAYRDNEICPSHAVEAEPILSWKVHLVREEPGKLFLILPVLIFSLLTCYFMFRSPLFLAAVLFMFLSSLADYLFPIEYEISAKGASARTKLGTTFIEWNRVRRCYVDSHGIKLSPLPARSRLENYRGVYLRFGDRREEVIETVRRMRDVVRSNA